MKNQFVSFLNALFTAIFSLVNSPQRIRLVVTIAVIVLIVLVALFVPQAAALADHMAGMG